jgi:TM2 domain-containing membrane protein YozV
MAKKSDYFGLGYVVSVILAIIPVTSWICGAVTRFTEGRIVAGILRLVLGWNIIWIVDLILMIVSKHILRLLNV